MNFSELSLELHEKNRGKIEVTSKVKVETNEDLSTAYTPGVAAPCRKIAENPEDVYKYTAKGNLVAVVTDGSAVLGLGNIGAKAALPVMEGKAILFKEFGDVDAFPIAIDSQNTDTIVETVKLISPGFGGINLEDIAAPRCFEIEERLKQELDIPVFHDDQHGTAIVVLAAVLNALKVVGKELPDLKIVVNGAGSAGTAIIKLLQTAGSVNQIACGREGAICKGVAGMRASYVSLAEITNPHMEKGSLADVIKGADIFIGVSGPNVLTADMIRSMNTDPIVFAMANPEPEILPDLAKEAGVRIMGTGRSDFPNQINNVSVFPGLFKGALRVRAREINEAMKLAAAQAIADYIPEADLNEENIMPSALNKNVADAVADAVAQAARDTGAARI
ncbi:MAG: NAD-dependent malic enzyme [Clostridiaceae bacterium]|jgi:malate dehydrogenase (oxaloacetate-decarboxylating)|nr:NAD-dependent malic enzyme [Clostridiaceae bacterium]